MADCGMLAGFGEDLGAIDGEGDSDHLEMVLRIACHLDPAKN